MDKLTTQTNKFNKIFHELWKITSLKEYNEKLSLITKLSDYEIATIRIISEKTNVIIKDIVNELEIPKSSLTSIINSLEDKGLIERQINKEDKRSYKLVLSPDGEKIQCVHSELELTYFTLILKCLDTESERDCFINLLEKIKNNLKNYDVDQLISEEDLKNNVEG